MRSFRSDRQLNKAEPDKVVRLFGSETAEIIEAPEPTGIRSTVYVLAALVIAAAVLSVVVRLDRVVTSEAGTIVTTRPTIVLQSLDTAVIKKIDVREGQRVKKGQLLATLDPTFATADVDALKLQIASLNAQIARCEAELANRPYVPAPSTDPAAVRYGQLQQAYDVQRRSQLTDQLRAYDAKIGEIHATIAKLKNDAARYGDRMRLAKEVEHMRATLAAAQVGSRLNLLSAADQKTELLRNLEYDQNALVESKKQLAATAATRNAYAQQWLAETSKELVTARNQRDAALQQLDKATKKKELVRLVAPEPAVVLQMAKLSVGSVLKEGEALIYLAPLNSPVEAEARISPKDIGFIRVGDPVRVKLDAFNFIAHGAAKGRIRWISDGAFTTDPTNGQPTNPYYKVRIRLTDTKLKNVPAGFRLIPGMTLTADVHIGTRSILTYLVQGVMMGSSEAMREP